MIPWAMVALFRIKFINTLISPKEGLNQKDIPIELTIDVVNKNAFIFTQIFRIIINYN